MIGKAERDMIKTVVVNEVKVQLEKAGLNYLNTKIISDRHLIVFGTIHQNI